MEIINVIAVFSFIISIVTLVILIIIAKEVFGAAKVIKGQFSAKLKEEGFDDVMYKCKSCGKYSKHQLAKCTHCKAPMTY